MQVWGPQPNPDTFPSSQTSAWGRMEIHNICLILPSNHFHTLRFRYDVYLRTDHMPVSLTDYKCTRLLSLKSLKWFCRGTRLPIRDEITSRHQIKSNTHLASVPAVRCCHGAAFLYTQLCLQMLRLPIWQHLGLSPNVSFTFLQANAFKDNLHFWGTPQFGAVCKLRSNEGLALFISHFTV